MGSWRKVGAFLGLVPEENRSYEGDDYDHHEYDTRDYQGRDYADEYDSADRRGSVDRSRYRSSTELDDAESVGRDSARAGPRTRSTRPTVMTHRRRRSPSPPDTPDRVVASPRSR